MMRLFAVAGIAVVGLVLGIGVSACEPSTSTAAASPTATQATPTLTATTSTSASSAAASTSSASASNAAASTAAPSSSSPAATPADSIGNAAPVRTANNGPYYVLWGCDNESAVEPSNYVLACGDGGNGLAGVHWTSWTPTGATGTGTEYLNSCIPDCAASKIINYPVDISLTGSYLAAQGQPFAYAKITLTYLAARPPIYVTVNGKVELTHPASWSPPLPERPETPTAS